MVKKREKNTFHFQSFNDQLSGIKVKTFYDMNKNVYNMKSEFFGRSRK